MMELCDVIPFSAVLTTTSSKNFQSYVGTDIVPSRDPTVNE